MSTSGRIAAFLLATIGACAAAAGCRQPAPSPVVVFVLVDTLRADHVGAYGDRRGLTPTIDRLAREGVVFERATAASSWTRASVASIFTGLFPETHAVVDREHSLPPQALTLAEVITAAGGTALGVQANGNVDRDYGFDAGFQRYVEPEANAGYPGDHMVSDARAVTDSALVLLDEFQQRPGPLFLYVHYIDPHDPYLPHPELGRGPLPDGRFDGSRKALHRMDVQRPGTLRAVDKARVARLYEDEVAFVDGHIGRLLSELEGRDLAGRTLVIVTADHGEGLWDHGERGHGRDLYEEQIHVPLVLRWPGAGAPRGLRVTDRVGHVDLAPTVLAALGMDAPGSWPGVDLGRVARGEAPGRGWAYSSLDLDWADAETVLQGDRKLLRYRGGDASRRGRRYTTRAGDTWVGLSWKFFGSGHAAAAFGRLNPEVTSAGSTAIPEGSIVTVPDTPPEQVAPLQLFDLAADPDETSNLAAAEPADAHRLGALLARITAPMLAGRDDPATVSEADLRPSTRQRLEALGYIE
jgi:arylsulfatase A-like enzyme